MSAQPIPPWEWRKGARRAKAYPQPAVATRTPKRTEPKRVKIRRVIDGDSLEVCYRGLLGSDSGPPVPGPHVWH